MGASQLQGVGKFYGMVLTPLRNLVTGGTCHDDNSHLPVLPTSPDGENVCLCSECRKICPTLCPSMSPTCMLLVHCSVNTSLHTLVMCGAETGQSWQCCMVCMHTESAKAGRYRGRAAAAADWNSDRTCGCAKDLPAHSDWRTHGLVIPRCPSSLPAFLPACQQIPVWSWASGWAASCRGTGHT